MNYKLLTFLAFWLMGLVGVSCKDDDEKFTNTTDYTILLGKWYYVTTQENERDQWFDFPMPVDGSEMIMEFLPDHTASITRTVGEQADAKTFTWELLTDGHLLIDGRSIGRLDFSGDARFYLHTTTTIDSFSGEILEGFFRDVYDRHPAPADKPGVITERPQGKVHHFSMEGRKHCYCVGMSSDLPFSGKTVEAVEGEQGVLYLKNLLPDMGLPNDYYLKAVVDHDRILVPLPQVISTHGKIDKYLWSGVKQSNEENKLGDFVSNRDKRFITFVKNEKGEYQLVAEVERLGIGLCDVNGEWLGKFLDPKVAYAVSGLILKPSQIHLMGQSCATEQAIREQNPPKNE